MKKVSRNIWYITGLFLFSACLFFGLTLQNNKRIAYTSQLVNHTYDVINHIKEVETSVSASEAALKNYLLKRDFKSRVEILQLHRVLSGQVTALEKLTKDNPVQRKNVILLLQQTTRKIDFEKLILRSPLTELPAIASDDEKERAVNKPISKTLNIIAVEENRLLKERVARSEASRIKNFYVTLGAGLLAFCFVVVILLGINRENRKRKLAEEEAKNNELKYKTLVEDASVVMYTASLQGKFTYASGRCFSLTGYTPDEIQGMHFTGLIEQSMHNEVAENYKNQLLSNTENTTFEFAIVTKEGKVKWVEQVASLIYEQEVASGFQCIVKDITEKKAAEAALRKKEHEIQTVLNNTKEGFFVIDTAYRIQILNKKAKEQIESISRNEAAVGMNFLAVVAEADREKAKANFDTVFKGESVTFEFLYNNSEGAVWSLISHSPIKNEDGLITGIAVITHDITEVKIAQEQISAANEKIAAVVASTREAFFMLKKDYTVSMVNDAGKKLSRLISGKEIGCSDNILHFIPYERRAIFLNIIKKVLNGKTEEAEEKITTGEDEIWIHNIYFPVYDSANTIIIGACISSKDITARKAAEKKLQQSWAEKEEYRLLLQSILDNTPLAIFVKDTAGRYLLVNKSFRDVTKLTDEKIIGKTDFDFANLQDAERYKKADDIVINTLHDIETEEILETENGRRHLLVVKFPLFDKDRNLYGIGAIATDITERTAYQQKIIEEKKKAEKAERLQEEFLANMSHEIRTPMNGITGMTTLLLNTTLSEEQREFIQLISRSSDNLLVLLNDLLDLSKIKAGKISIESIPFSLTATLDAVINPYRIKAKEKNLELFIQHDITIPNIITGDPHRLTQILSNLLSNAIKFTEQGYIKLSASKIMQKENTVTLEFSVTDTGIGIPEEKIEMIFESFYQHGADTARKFGGTGLGLSISKKLAELQHGRINVSSKVGAGSTFSVVLNYTVQEENNCSKNNYTNTLPASDTALAERKVLIAEDNHINQRVLLNLLKKWNMQVTIAGNGKEAVEILQKDNRFDLVLMDLQMPEMDGLQTAAFIRGKLALDIPIIAMTASAMRNEKNNCLSVGMNEYIAKPFSFAQLTETMQRLLVNGEKKYSTVENATSLNGVALHKYYSLQYLQEVGDNDYYCEILEMFLADTPLMLQEIKEEIFCEQWSMVHKAAHKLKSSLGILQMRQMHELIGYIEQMAAERTGLENIKEYIDKAIELFRIIRPMIEAELCSIKAVNI